MESNDMKDKINEIVGKVESGHLEPKEASEQLFDLFGVSSTEGKLPRCTNNDREKMIEALIKAGGGSLPFMLTDE
jgi:hypothetical protein